MANAATERASMAVGFLLRDFPTTMARLAPREAANAVNRMRISRRLLKAL